jgi:hypothetical protein
MVCSGGPGEPEGGPVACPGAKVGSSTNLQQGDREDLEDMRHLKTAFGLAAAICLLGALAAPALAHEFVASKYKHEASEVEPFKTTTKSLEETRQKFVFGRRTIECQKAIGKGIITEDVSSAISTHLVFGKCGYLPIPTKPEEFIPMSIKGGLGIKFKVDGAGEFEGNGEGEELEYGTKAELLETAAKFYIGAGKYCGIIVPQQTVPAKAKVKPEEEYSQVKYSNDLIPVEETPTKLKLFPGGFQHKLLLTFALQPFKYKYQEETQCFEHEEKVEFGSGQYKGELLTEVNGGNLEFK